MIGHIHKQTQPTQVEVNPMLIALAVNFGQTGQVLPVLADVELIAKLADTSVSTVRNNLLVQPDFPSRVFVRSGSGEESFLKRGAVWRTNEVVDYLMQQLQ